MKIKDKPQTVLRESFGSMKFGDSKKILKEMRTESKFKRIKSKKI